VEERGGGVLRGGGYKEESFEEQGAMLTGRVGDGGG
jgi:hypothetical protein